MTGDRHNRGAYYTPPELARPLTAATLEGLCAADGGPPRVLDPACGAGDFLAAAGHDLIERWGEGTRRELPRLLQGMELEEEAAGAARRRLGELSGTSLEAWRKSIVVGDALLGEVRLSRHGPDAWDAVLTNPPFLNAIERRSRPAPERKRRLKERFTCAVGPVDAGVLFAELALELVRDGGRVGLVLPNKYLAAGYAARWREWALERSELRLLADYSAGGHFSGAAVYPVGVVLVKTPPRPGYTVSVQRRDGRLGEAPAPTGLPGWGPLLAADPAAAMAELERTPRLDEFYDVRAAATVAEAYELRRSLIDGAVPGEAFPFVTSGALERGRHRFGEIVQRYLGRDYHEPRLPVAAPELSSARRELYGARKVLVAGMTAGAGGLRAVLDPGGLAAAVSVTTIRPRTDREPPLSLGELTRWLNGPVATRLYRALWEPLALAGGYLRVGPPQLRALPLP